MPEMTSAQRTVLKAGLVVAVVAGLFPPWQVDMGGAGIAGVSGIVGRGHHFILGRHGSMRIDIEGLFVIWIVVALITATVFAFMGERKTETQNSRKVPL